MKKARVECLYCGNSWMITFYIEPYVVPCSVCKEKENIRIINLIDTYQPRDPDKVKKDKLP